MQIIIRYFAVLACFSFILACGGEVKQEQQSGDSVLRDLNTLLSKEPNSPSLHIQRANYLYEQGSFDAAIDDVKQAMKLDSLQPSYYYLLSDIYLDYYQSKNALFTLQTAQHLFPSDIRTQLKLCEDYFILKDLDNALIHAHKVLNLDKQNGDAYFMIGLINQELGNIDNAIKSLKIAVEYDPDITDAWMLLGDLLASKHDPQAVKYYEAAIEVDRTNVNAIHAKAYFLQNHDEISSALDLYDEIHIIDKQYEPAYLNSGILYITLDSIQKAYDKFNILVNMSPANAQGYYYRGLTHSMMNNVKLAKADFEAALKFQPDFTKAKQALAELGQ